MKKDKVQKLFERLGTTMYVPYFCGAKKEN